MLLLTAVSAMAQASATDGSTPSGLAPGAPAGSYSLSGFENVNLFNGNLNFNMPLLKIGGRGGAQIPVTLKIDSVHWRVLNESATSGAQAFPFSQTYPSPIIDSETGFAPVFSVEPDWWEGLRPGYGPGVLQARVTRSKDRTSSLTRLIFTAPDGTEYELRDMENSGKPLTGATRSRGTVFVSTDGSSVTFVSSATIYDLWSDPDGLNPNISGYLMMADGMRYDITGGLVRTITDRNGNRLNFTYDDTNAVYEKRRVLTILDSLGRQVIFNYDLQDSVGKYDRIKYNGFGGSERVIKVRRAYLASALRQTRSGDSSTTKVYSELFPRVYEEGFGSSPNVPYNPDDVISAIELPDGRSYRLYYNVYHELARIELPTGGAIEYDYTAPADSVIRSYSYQIHRRVTERRLYGDGGALQSKHRYLPTYTGTTSGNVTTWETKIEMQQHDMLRTPDDTLVSIERHTFFGSPVPTLFKSGLDYSAWKDGKEKQTETFDSTGNPLRVVTNEWQQCIECETSISWWTNTRSEETAPSNNPHVIATVTTLKDTTPNLTTKQSFKYDKYNNLTDTFDYDYHPGASAAAYPVRHTKIDYLAIHPVSLIDYRLPVTHLRGLPTLRQIYAVNPLNGTETLMAKSEALYDEGLYQLGNNEYSAVIQWIAPATAARGNATTIKKWYDVTSANSYIDSHMIYDQCGNARETWTLRQKTPTPVYAKSKITYSSHNNSYTFPTETLSPVPDANGTYSSNSELISSSTYDFSTGLVTSTTDANNKITTMAYDDPLDRPTRINLPDGGWTSYEYGDRYSLTPDPEYRYVKTQTALDSSHTTESYQYYDSLGRKTRSLTKVGTSWSSVDTKYDGFGRALKVSNPYGSASLGAAVNEAALWIKTTYDALGRVKTVTTPDNAVVVTTYDGARVLVTEQSGKRRASQTNALGQLTDVWEITPAQDAGDPVSVGGTTYTGYRTSYTYDALSNLRTIAQGAQRRYFIYDALSRLLYARYPEQGVIANLSVAGGELVENNSQWSLAYSYDASGNLATRQDARGVVATYGYDALNRSTTIAYTDGTPGITRRYDSATNGKGRLWQSETAGGAGTRMTIDAYDAMGRPLTQRQQFRTSGAWGQSYTVQRGYSLSGQMTSQTYPSGHVATYEYEASGRLEKFKGNLGDGVPRDYATGMSYDEAGRMREEKYGTLQPLYHKLKYNVRGQLNDVRLSTMSRAQSETDWNRGCLALSYATQNLALGSGTDNNGNLIKAENYVPQADGGYYLAQDNYTYDALNRLDAMTESPFLNGQAQGGFTQDYEYDRYGNRTIKEATTTAGINRQPFEVETGTNRLLAPGDLALSMNQRRMRHDAVGNLTFDSYTGMGSRAYDAENRMTTATDNSSQTSSYTYDADGRRVRRNTISQGEVWQVYGMEGELVAEYPANAPSFIPSKEYGYRSGQLLVTAANGDEQRLTRFIHQLYRGSLGRDATSAEMQNWFGWLAAQGSVSQNSLLAGAKMMAATLFDSADYYYRYRTNRQLVQDLYWSYFGRGASQSEEDMWAGRLATGSSNPITRAELRAVCENWGEFTSIVASLWGASSTENERTEHMLWNIYLGATGTVPSAAQMESDINALNLASASGKEAVIAKARELARAQIESTAYASRNRTNQQYVQDLYQAFWQRTPEQSGWDYWTSQVNLRGRANVLDRISDSTAFMEMAGTLYRETLWLIADQLGTPRMIAERTGSLAGIKRHDYLPFGEEVMAGVAGRTSAQGYVTDSVRQQFTSKERDDETGLDYFGARYHSNLQGRFTSVDPIKLKSSRLYDPQRINLYNYCRANPLKYIDPDGEDVIPVNEKSAAQLRADLDKNLRANERANVRIEAGQKVKILDSIAVDSEKASQAYKYLLEVAGPGKTYNYSAVSEGDDIRTSDGQSLAWNDVRGGAAIPIDTTDLRTATVIDILVPTTDAPDVLGESGGFVPFPRNIVTVHELLGHGRCGQGQCAVDAENNLRDAQNPALPRRSGADHESLSGERPGNQGSTNENVGVSPPLEPVESTPSQIYTGPLPQRPLK